MNEELYAALCDISHNLERIAKALEANNDRIESNEAYAERMAEIKAKHNRL